MRYQNPIEGPLLHRARPWLLPKSSTGGAWSLYPGVVLVDRERSNRGHPPTSSPRDEGHTLGHAHLLLLGHAGAEVGTLSV